MDPINQFNEEKKQNIEALGKNEDLNQLGLDFLIDTAKDKYTYNFTWMGRPIIAFPQDMVAMQEIIWDVKPELIIETGVAHGGSIVYYASLLELLGNNGLVVGIDIDIRAHNRKLIEEHPMSKRIKLVEGSSISEKVFDEVKNIAKGRNKIMICLDSNHTHEHVLEELKLYAPLTSVGSYCVVFDTVVEDMPDSHFENRPWGHGNNPKTAVWEFLKTHEEFEIDKGIQDKLLITVAPDGYLKRIR
ncbi:MAG: cephalosporin hydroxylase family protein [Bacteroidota bacterium]|nr:cephalosporin hydroxylase family protein [Bacteroidota bacterium]